MGLACGETNLVDHGHVDNIQEDQFSRRNLEVNLLFVYMDGHRLFFHPDINCLQSVQD